MAENGLAQPSQTSHMPHDSALSVGSSKGDDATKIRELENEVHELAEKANAASQRFADYENEIRVLEAKVRHEQRKNAAASESGEASQAPAKLAQRPGISRFGSFIGSRKEPGQQNGALPVPGSGGKELEEKFVREQTARIAAEKKVKEVNAEIEELSATLFTQANEMVATERKQNAELKEKLKRVEQQAANGAKAAPAKASAALQKENAKLKEKILALERRDSERKKRLERLEAANKRIERVRAMLQPP